MSSWTIWEPSFLPNQTLKYISRLRWLISPNSVCSYPEVFSFCLLRSIGSLAADTTRIRSQEELTNRRATTRSRLEESPFSWSEGLFLFLSSMHRSTSCLGLLGFFAFFLFIFILLFLFTPTVVWHQKINIIKMLSLCHRTKIGRVGKNKCQSWSQRPLINNKKKNPLWNLSQKKYLNSVGLCLLITKI